MPPSTLILFMAFFAADVPAQTNHALSFADVARPKPGEWPTYHGNLSGNRFSPLDQINATTIHSLAPKWMFTIQGAPRALQMTPVVVDGVMYVTSVNEAYALDARRLPRDMPSQTKRDRLQARNLFEVIGHLQRAEGLQFELSLKAAS